MAASMCKENSSHGSNLNEINQSTIREILSSGFLTVSVVTIHSPSSFNVFFS